MAGERVGEAARPHRGCVLNSFRWTRLPHTHHRPCHVGLIPWDKLAEPACLRITSPRYTLRLYTSVANPNRPRSFLRRVSDSWKLATNRSVVVCFSVFFFFFFIRTVSPPQNTRIKQANEPIYDPRKAKKKKKTNSSVNNFLSRGD